MIKIIFSDFDNTLLDYYSENNYFDAYKIGILKRLKDKGIKFCIVTGRCVSFFEQFPNLLEVVDYIIASNGSCIYDVKGKKNIYHDVIDVDSFDKVIDFLIENQYVFNLNCSGKEEKFNSMGNNGNYLCEQIIFKFNKVDYEKVFKRLENISNIKLNNLVINNDVWNVDINSSTVSKGNAVVWMCEYLKIDIVDAMVFGDGDNDKTMFEEVNKGIAVGNAVDKLKVLSKDIALNCDNNGIYKYIEDNILK